MRINNSSVSGQCVMMWYCTFTLQVSRNDVPCLVTEFRPREAAPTEVSDALSLLSGTAIKAIVKRRLSYAVPLVVNIVAMLMSWTCGGMRDVNKAIPTATGECRSRQLLN